MMLKSSLSDYSDTYKIVKETLTIPNTTAAGTAANNANKKVVINNCAPFSDCISEINNIQVDNVKYIDVMIPIYNLIEYRNNYSKTSESLWQYYRDEPALNDASSIMGFRDAINGALF